MTQTGRSGQELVSSSHKFKNSPYGLLNTRHLVRSLSQKYKTAKLALKSVVVAFKGLTGSVGNTSWIMEWEALEALAIKQRGEAMMIYNVTPVQGISCPVAQELFGL
jgi:hypothetical protein